MNSRQLQYAVVLSEIRNFSQVAEKLNISQPALSKQILNLESELGLKLFDRSTSPLSLTPAGEHFIQEAKDLLYKEDQLKRSLEGFKSGDKGRLVIGVSPFRCLYFIEKMVQRIRERFPGVQICLHETGSDQLRKDVAEGRFDFAIINLPVDESVLDIIPLEPDKMCLVVPKQMMKDIAGADESPCSEIELKDCQNLPFIVVGQTQEMRQLFDKLCVAASFHPNIIMEVVGLTTAWAMAVAGIGATLLPLQFAEKFSESGNIEILSIKGLVSSRQPAIVTKRGQFLSEYAKFAIQSLVEVYFP